MKWFKHQTDLSRDEGVRRYLEQSGKDRLSAYGFLLILLEIIGEKMSANRGDLHCSAEYSIREWSRVIDCHVSRVKRFMEYLGVIPWVSVEFEESICRVQVDKMWEWRDETTRKSGATPEQFAQSREEQNRTEKRESRDEGSHSDRQKAEGSRISPPPDFKIAESSQEWAAKNYPSVNIQKETDKFLRHEYSTPRTNWDNAWKNWIQRGYEYQQKQNGSSAKPSYKEEILKIGKDLSLGKKSGEPEADYIDRIEKFNQRRMDSLDS